MMTPAEIAADCVEVKPQKPIRAFAVMETEENTGMIVFARHAIVARREGAGKVNGGEFEGLTCRRASWADQFSETRIVPIKDAIKHGWHFECTGCGRRIDDEEQDEDFDDDGDPIVPARPFDPIGTMMGWAYCSPECKASDDANKAEDKAAGEAFLAILDGIVMKRFPDAELLVGPGGFCRHAYVQRGYSGLAMVEQAVVSFDFPGRKIAPATLRYETNDWRRAGGPHKPNFSVCAGDVPAFNAWAAEPFFEETKP
jgi:hypothetical protein